MLQCWGRGEGAFLRGSGSHGESFSPKAIVSLNGKNPGTLKQLNDFKKKRKRKKKRGKKLVEQVKMACILFSANPTHVIPSGFKPGVSRTQRGASHSKELASSPSLSFVFTGCDLAGGMVSEVTRTPKR